MFHAFEYEYEYEYRFTEYEYEKMREPSTLSTNDPRHGAIGDAECRRCKSD